MASSAQGTSVAVACSVSDTNSNSDDNRSNRNGVVLLIRSAAPTSKLHWKPATKHSDWIELNVSNNNDDDDKIKILETPMNHFVATSPSHSRTSWLPLGTTSVCAMTGLTSDIDHVCRVVQKQVDTHRYIYDHTSFPAPISHIVKTLAGTVQDAAQYAGGRPYGLQALVVGQEEDSVSASAALPSRRRSLYVYTVDPSGSWRHWGSGCTAIGKNAEQVRSELYKELVDNKSFALNPRSALQVAMKSLLQAMRAAYINIDSDSYEAVLFWVDPVTNRCRVASLDPREVQACREELWKAIQ